MNRIHHLIMLAIILIAWPVSGWITQTSIPPGIRRTVSFRISRRVQQSDFVDVEFESVDENHSSSKEEVSATATSDLDSNIEDDDNDVSSKTLLDLSLDSDPDWKEAQVPFVDGDNVISVKLAFMAELDGVSYGIGIPFEPSAALAFEDRAADSVTYLSPDDDENQELMEIMAAQLREHVGEDLLLKRTPRVLTIEGPLDKYTKNWREHILPDPVDAKTLMEDDDEDLDFFHKFMKEELGEEEYEKTLQKETTDDINDELMALFDVPGLGTREDDTEGLEELLKSMLDDPDEQMKAQDDLGSNVNHEGVGLKLVSYIMPGGKAYSLVQLLKPYILVGKYVEDGDDTHFELLAPDDAQVVIPKLEDACKKDFEKAGLTLRSS